MIGRLTGLLLTKRPPRLLLDVAGVGYEIDAPLSAFYGLPAAGERVTLYTHLALREDGQQLYGFLAERERELFRLLIKVSGVGPRTALAVLSGMDVEAFWSCIERGDAARLTRVPGIGRKTAERLIVDMRDRLTQWEGATAELPARSGGAAQESSPAADAMSALIALGYPGREAERLVRAVPEADLAVEEIIRRALRLSLPAG